MKQIDIDEEELSVSSEVEQNLAEYRNIALFGIDSRQDTYSRGNRSDCIIIASINKKTNAEMKEIILAISSKNEKMLVGYSKKNQEEINEILKNS